MRSTSGFLLVTHPSGRQEARALLTSGLRVGSAVDNDLVLAGAEVRPQHASIRCDETGDLLITVAGMEVELPRSSAGAAVLRVGGYVLQFAYEVPAEQVGEYVMLQPSQAAQYARVEETDLLSALLAHDAWAVAAPNQSDMHEAITIEMSALMFDPAE